MGFVFSFFTWFDLIWGFLSLLLSEFPDKRFEMHLSLSAFLWAGSGMTLATFDLPGSSGISFLSAQKKLNLFHLAVVT